MRMPEESQGFESRLRDCLAYGSLRGCLLNRSFLIDFLAGLRCYFAC